MIGDRGRSRPTVILTDSRTARKLDETDGYWSMALIREPYERLISAYINKFVKRREKFLTSFDDLEHFSQDFAQQIAQANQPDPDIAETYKGLSFSVFANHICDVIDNRKQEPLLDGHWNTQAPLHFCQNSWKTMFRDSFYTPKSTYKLENINLFFDELGRRLDVSEQTPPAKENVSQFSPETATDLTEKGSIEICELGTFSHASFESERLRARVQKSFANDYHYYQTAV